MKNKKIAKVVVTGMLIAGLTTSFGGPVLADTTTENTGAADIAAGKAIVFSIAHRDADQSILKEALADLVTDSTITQDQADAVLTHFQQNLPEKPVRKKIAPVDDVNKSEQRPVLKIANPMQALVDNGTITEDQAQSIRDKMRDISSRQMQQQLQTSLNTMVSEGAITLDQADKILTFLEANKQDKQSLFEQTKDMSKEEMTRYLKENLGDIKDPVSQMVEQDIITQEQADALRQALPSLQHVVRMQKLSPQQVQANLDALVTQGTITQDQVTDIQAFLADNVQKLKGMKQSIQDQTKDMSQEERAQFLKENLGNLKDPASTMVDEGIITEQQADAVREAINRITRQDD